MIKTLLRRFFRPAVEPKSEVTSEDILSRLDPWTLACAVGAMNGSMYGSIGTRGLIDFEMWFSLVRKGDWKDPEQQTIRALRLYAETHKGKHMTAVLHEEEERRGSPKSFVLGPGESTTISIPIEDLLR